MLFFLSVDPFLGKVDKHSLSQETLLEILVQGFTTNKDKICGPEKNPKDTSQWYETYRDASNAIVEIEWPCLDLEGSIDLKWLPLALARFFIQQNRLTGTADLTCLPDTLEILSLSRNQFHRTIDLTQLPGRLISLYLDRNNFFGKTDFSQLPEALKWLNISYTQLEGEIYHRIWCLEVDGSNVKDMRKNR